MKPETNNSIIPFVADGTVRAIGLLFLVLGGLKIHGIIWAKDALLAYLQVANPVFWFLSNSAIMTITAAVEVFIGVRCLRGGEVVGRACVLLWFASSAVCYKIALIYVNYTGPCGCLFGINRFLPISTNQQRWISDMIILSTLMSTLAIIAYHRLRKTRGLSTDARAVVQQG